MTLRVFVHVDESKKFAERTWQTFRARLEPFDLHLLVGKQESDFLSASGVAPHKIVHLDPGDAWADGPPAIHRSIRVLQHLNTLSAEEIHVTGPVGFGILYAVENAKHLGFATKTFRTTGLRTPTARSLAHSERRFFGTLRDLCVEFMEAYAALHSDEVLGSGPPLAQLAMLERRARQTFPGSETPKTFVNVIITHFNRSDVIQATLDGYNEQTYRNFDITIVDDGSTEEHFHALSTLVSQYDALDIKLHRQENAYLGAARNHGAAVTNGEFLVFNDDDNVPLPFMLERLVVAAGRSGADIVTTAMQKFEVRGSKGQRRLLGTWAYLGGALPAALFDNVLGDANAIYRRTVFDDLQFHTVRGVGHEDYELFTRALLLGKHIESVCDPCYLYRKDSTSMLHTTARFDNSERHLRAFQELDSSEVQAILSEAALAASAQSDGLFNKRLRSRLKTSYMRLPTAFRKALRLGRNAVGF